MKLDAVNKWLTLLANFGVIGGLVLVAIQMNFNTKTISLQNDLELNRALAAGTRLHGRFDPDSVCERGVPPSRPD